MHSPDIPPFVVPKFPVVSDASLLSMVWQNSIPNDGDVYMPTPEWNALERYGDGLLRVIFAEQLARMFGESNYRLLAYLSNHVNSNVFFAAIADYYNLKAHVRRAPEGPKLTKQKANLFEALIGAHIKERRLYDDSDPLFELQYFIFQVCALRYKQLKVYSYFPDSSVGAIPPGQISDINISPISIPVDILFKMVLGAFMGDRTNPVVIGYLVDVEVVTTNASGGEYRRGYQSFSTNQEEAQEMSRFQKWTNPSCSIQHSSL